MTTCAETAILSPTGNDDHHEETSNPYQTHFSLIRIWVIQANN